MKMEDRVKTGILVTGIVLGLMASAVFLISYNIVRGQDSSPVKVFPKEERFVVLHNSWDTDNTFKFTVVEDRKTGKQYLLVRTTNLGTPVITEIGKENIPLQNTAFNGGRNNGNP